MSQNYHLIISGKNIVLNAQGFIDALKYEASPNGSSVSFDEGTPLLDEATDQPTILATVHKGQPIVLDSHAQQPSPKLETTLMEFTRYSGTDALSISISDEGSFSAYHYFRDGKMLRAVTNIGHDVQTEGIAIPYEEMGVDPQLVLTAFCDSWLVLKHLPWTVFHFQKQLQTEAK